VAACSADLLLLLQRRRAATPSALSPSSFLVAELSQEFRFLKAGDFSLPEKERVFRHQFPRCAM
jgi:hypothetical protein